MANPSHTVGRLSRKAVLLGRGVLHQKGSVPTEWRERGAGQVRRMIDTHIMHAGIDYFTLMAAVFSSVVFLRAWDNVLVPPSSYDKTCAPPQTRTYSSSPLSPELGQCGSCTAALPSPAPPCVCTHLSHLASPMHCLLIHCLDQASSPLGLGM